VLWHAWMVLRETGVRFWMVGSIGPSEQIMENEMSGHVARMGGK
jgi:chloramphenicol 3-O-phosphotransferase